MGNLRDKYTDEEWEIILSNPDPKLNYVSLPLYNKNLEDLIKLKEFLTNLYSEHYLNNIQEWIDFKSNKQSGGGMVDTLKTIMLCE